MGQQQIEGFSNPLILLLVTPNHSVDITIETSCIGGGMFDITGGGGGGRV